MLCDKNEDYVFQLYLVFKKVKIINKGGWQGGETMLCFYGE